MDTLAAGSAGALVVFSVGYVSRLINLQLKKNIHANTLGQSGKPRPVQRVEWLIWMATMLVIILWVLSFSQWNRDNWPDLIRWLLLPLADSPLAWLPLRIIGVIFSWLGALLFVAAVLNMGLSWRVGIDASNQPQGELVTHGLFAYSRNPIYVAFRLLFTGAFMTWPGLWIGLASLVTIISLHMLTRYEETYLLGRYGEPYLVYCEKTPRYLLPKREKAREQERNRVDL